MITSKPAESRIPGLRDFSLTNDGGMCVIVSNFGAAVRSIRVPDRNRVFADVVLGYNSMDEYISDTKYIGVAVGRFANRIRDGRFRIGETEYQVSQNEGKNHLHGGHSGFNKKIWDFEIHENAVSFACVSADGEEGYPGKLTAKITYCLTADNALDISYEARTDKATLINMTNHSYFNLNGGAVNALGHVLFVNADTYTPADEAGIPTGEISCVRGTPLDFRKPRKIGGGYDYDHNFVLNGTGLREAASLFDETSGRYMEVLTDQPAMQVYTGNHLDEPYSAVCLETQIHPDAINHENFPSPVLAAGEVYRHRTIYRFSVK